MNLPIGLALEQFLAFTLVLGRLSGLMILAPLFGAPEIPPRVRILLAVTLALVVSPIFWGASVAWPGSLLGYAWLMAGELAIGLVLGLGMQALFIGLQLAGQMIGQQTGMALGNVFNPQFEAEISVLGQLYYLLGLAIFLIVGGHRLLLGAVLDTFRAIPLAGAGFTSGMVETLVTLVGQSFSLAVRAGAPAVVSLLLAGLAMGIMGRTVPQINILVVGFSVRSLLGMAVVAVSVFGVALLMREQVPVFIDSLRFALGIE